MFCHKCGKEIESADKFCTDCGRLVVPETQEKFITNNELNQKWWHRLLKVIYIFLYLQILWIVPAAWSENSSSYIGYYLGKSNYKNTYGKAFWYSFLSIVIFMVIIRLLKLTVLYIALAQKPQWNKEFKKLF